MRSFFRYSFLLSILVFFNRCEKVISLNIDNEAQQVVIEGVITDDGTCRVRLSQSGNFADTLNLKGLDGAVVTISEEHNTPVKLNPTNFSGIYTTKFSGRPGYTYHLKVEVPVSVINKDGSTAIEQKTFTASSTMPAKVHLDSLFVTERFFLGETRLIASIRYNDPPTLGNTYRFVQYVDGRPESALFLTKDDLINGRSVVDELLIFNDEYTLRKCDQLRVELQCIDPAVYLFWYSLSQNALGSSQSGSPGNPAGNIVGGALGYFSAYTVSAQNIAVFPDGSCSLPAD